MLANLISYLKKSDFYLSFVYENLSLTKIVRAFLRSALFLTGVAWLLIIVEMIAPFFFILTFGAYDIRKITTIIYVVMYAWLFYVAVPVSLNKVAFKDSLRDLGLRFPENKKLTVFLIVCSLLILAPNIFYFAKLKEFQVSYPIGQPGVAKFAFIELILLPLYYFAEEFFFRGFLFFGLWRKVKWHSFWITDILFTYAHLGKPGLEIMLAVPASVVLNYLTLKTRSIYPAVLVHATLGALLNILLYGST